MHGFISLPVYRNSLPLQISSPVNDERDGHRIPICKQCIDEEALAVGGNLVITSLLSRVGQKQRPYGANIQS
jgi:hypothetical protein